MALAPKKIVLISVISAAAIVGVGYLVMANSGTHIPAEFFSNKIDGAGAAKNIAQLVSASLSNLDKIEAYDNNGNSQQALVLVNYERSTGKEKQDAAVRLSGDLEQMAKATQDIEPEAARELSLQAVSTGVSMVSRIISYNSLLDTLFGALNAKFSGQAYTGPSVKDTVDQMNVEAQTINDLNQQFNALLAQFDQQFVK